MARRTIPLASLVCFLFLSSVASAGPTEQVVEFGERKDGPKALATPGSCGACANCAAQIPILESGRPPLPGEEGSGVDSCTLINTSADWDTFCLDNVVPDCPLLDDAFFAEHTAVAIVIDTVTVRPCDGSPDPLWKLDCVQTRSGATGVRVVKQRPGGWCRCSAMPQHLQRLFLASAVAKTQATGCRPCVESHTLGCLR